MAKNDHGYRNKTQDIQADNAIRSQFDLIPGSRRYNVRPLACNGGKNRASFHSLNRERTLSSCTLGDFPTLNGPPEGYCLEIRQGECIPPWQWPNSSMEFLALSEHFEDGLHAL